ncbi:MAG: tRNA 2-thiouridine(34) synthase MnmA [Planctomycetes bacterium]|nr:tRNA 2-thiouridine(34) synthase MnmA [Planctomycetota bacterium]
MSSVTPSSTARRFVVAMSGGVDSSVAAWMLKQEGLDLVGLFMRNGVHVEEAESAKKSCCSVGDARDARMVAAHLGVPFQSVDLKDEFGAIIRYFLAEYARGRTPNPCAVCNRDLKFDRLLRFARDLGAEGVATGHYARLALEDGRVVLRRGLDESKDQSYQLFSVAEANLARTRLPLGDLKKTEVRALAKEAGLRTAVKKDSQEICFVPSNDYRKLLEERGAELHPGALVDTAGAVLGAHAGTEHFTIGQRRGHGVAGGEPLYVVELHPDEGRVVLGARDECGIAECAVETPNWIGFDPPSPGGSFRCRVQHRYRSTPAEATVAVRADGARVVFDAPEFAVTAGQGAAFYAEDRLLGGGWIATTKRAGG